MVVHKLQDKASYGIAFPQKTRKKSVPGADNFKDFSTIMETAHFGKLGLTKLFFGTICLFLGVFLAG